MTRKIVVGDSDETVVTGSWLRLSSRITDCVPVIAGREDLIVTIAPGAGQGAPACFIPARAEIEVDGGFLDVPPSTCNPRNFSDRNRYPALWGAVCHEAAHANHSRWLPGVPDDADEAAVNSALLLEESRIEARHLKRRFADRRWLRSCALAIVMKDVDQDKDMSSNTMAAQAAGLILARVDARVLDDFEVEKVEKTVKDCVGMDVFEKLQAIWLEAQDVGDEDAAAMLELGKRWAELVGPPPNDGNGWKPQDKKTAGEAAGEAKPGGEGEGEGDDGQAGGASPELADAVAQAMKSLAQGIAEKDKEMQAAVGFGIAYTPAAPERSANTNERQLAAQLARRIRKVYFAERTETRLPAELPPGKLRMRHAMSRDAQLAARGRSNAQPFSRTKRQQTYLPPLRIGFIADDRDSMSCMTSIIQSMGWVMLHAIRSQPDARAAGFSFGSKTRWPINDTVPNVGRGGSGDTGICSAIDHIGGELQLLNPGFGRLLIVVSDAFFTAEESRKASRTLERHLQAGCRVLWLDCTVEHSREGAKVKMPAGVRYARIPFDNLPKATAIAYEMLYQSLNQAQTRAPKPKGTRGRDV